MTVTRSLLLQRVRAVVTVLAVLGATRVQAQSEPALSAVWANDGGSKVTRDELRARAGGSSIQNAIWDGQTIKLSAARNEVIGFNLILEAAQRSASQITVQMPELRNESGDHLRSGPRQNPDGLFRWVGREIELFYVRYLPIRGLSRMSYETYDERHVPERFRRPHDRNGEGKGSWADRPDHDRDYPDIAVPLELVRDFPIAAGTNQSVWFDIYVPKAMPVGQFTGSVIIGEPGQPERRVPVELTVFDFTLPDVPTSKTMLYISPEDISTRYTGTKYPDAGSVHDQQTRSIMLRHAALAHRHKISTIGGGEPAGGIDQPSLEWIPALSGELFSTKNGYDGPGVGTGLGVFSIGTYGSWQNRWGVTSPASIRRHADEWEAWFLAHQAGVERFLYLADELPDLEQMERWAAWLKQSPGPGRELRSFATVGLLKAKAIPSLDWVASTMGVGEREPWQRAVDALASEPHRKLIMYNAQRPASGSFATEDDGVALRELPWGQFKKNIARWFFWEGTYYNNYQGGQGETNVFRTAQTFGAAAQPHPVLGQTSWNYSNGDGVLFYPGTDHVFPQDSYGIDGPIASLRLKQWRRGIQDVDYLMLAQKIAPDKVSSLVEKMAPKVMWEYGVSDPNDPSWVRSPISWSTNPDDWETARLALAKIILSGQKTAGGVPAQR